MTEVLTFIPPIYRRRSGLSRADPALFDQKLRFIDATHAVVQPPDLDFLPDEGGIGQDAQQEAAVKQVEHQGGLPVQFTFDIRRLPGLT